MSRCEWAKGDLYEKYHDEEWGVTVHDDQKLFEFLILEGAQAGLSWITILQRREGYRRAFKDFDAQSVAAMTDCELEETLLDPGIIRNRLKVFGARKNAQAFLEIQEEFGTFDAYIWRFVDGAPIQNSFRTLSEIPATTPISDALSKDLKSRGMTFVGSTIMYAHMQATGMVNDHVTACPRHRELGGPG